MITDYVIKPFTIEDFNKLDEKDRDELTRTTFGSSNPDEILDRLLHKNCRFDFFQVFTPDAAIGIISLQWYPVCYKLVPLIHYHIYHGCVKEALQVAEPVVEAMCNHFNLEKLTIYEPSASGKARQLMRIMGQSDRLRLVTNEEEIGQ